MKSLASNTLIWLFLLGAAFPCRAADSESPAAPAIEIPVQWEILADAYKISADEPFSQLYIRWNQTPDGRFLHEFIALERPEAAHRLPLADGAQPLGIYAFGPGEVPDWVQKWQPPCEDADLLVMPTHADDEHLYFGGALPFYAGERQMAVQVVYLTRHEQEPYRPHELLDGLWAAGVRNYPVISDFADQYAETLEQARQIYDEDEWLKFQVEQLRRFNPEVALGHDLLGEYGHGTHMLNAATLRQAVEISADESRFPESAAAYGAWQPQKLYLHLFPENSIVMDWSVPLDRFDGKTALDAAKEGFAAHVSQQAYFQVEDSGPYDCRKFGLAFTAVGPDVRGDDFFENVAQAGEARDEPESPASASGYRPIPELESAVTRKPGDAIDPPPPALTIPSENENPGVAFPLIGLALVCLLTAGMVAYKGRREEK